MSKYESSRDLACKADNEGGLDGMVFGYGLAVADLPDDMPADIVEAIQKLLAVTGDYEKAEAYLNERLEDDSDDW
jgi:hypothetical protein